MRKQSDPEALKTALVDAIPFLRALAFTHCGDKGRADDLVQETLEKAISSIGSFTEGTNLKAWLATILRNSYLTEHRKRRHETPDPDGAFAAQIAVPASQTSHMDFRDFAKALQQVSPEQREALMLVFAIGMSYEEAAEFLGCAVGTLKSRVSRGRDALVKLLGSEVKEARDANEPVQRKPLEPIARKKENPRSEGDKPRKG